MSTVVLPEQDDDVVYPSSNGEPMAETTLHVQAIIWLFEALQGFFRSAADVFVAADLFWYWEEGNPSACKAPDVMVVKGVDKRERRCWFGWKENNPVPNAVFEIASKSTWRECLFEKCRLYAQLRVPEYFIFDPEAEYLRPPLQGFRLSDKDGYLSIHLDELGRIKSEQLGLYLKAEGAMLRLIDVTTALPLPSKDECLAQRDALIAQQDLHIAQQDERIAQLQALLEQATGKKAP